jgi:hypothetical protein
MQLLNNFTDFLNKFTRKFGNLNNDFVGFEIRFANISEMVGELINKHIFIVSLVFEAGERHFIVNIFPFDLEHL